jgi:hypothetical protein
MAELIFNRASDNHIFTGSRLRAPPSKALRLSTANNEALIDLCNNSNVDISATAVYINGLKVVTTSNGATTALTGLQLTQNLDVSGAINSDGGIRIGSGVFGGTITKSTNAYEIVIDPFGIDVSNSSTQDASGQVVIMGDLVVRGNTTTIYSTNVDISDVLLTLASGSTSALKSNNAGIQLGNGYASLLYDSSDNRWKTNIGLNISGGTTNNGPLYINGNLTCSGTSKIMTTFAGTILVRSTELSSNIGDICSNEWLSTSGWYATIMPVSVNSCVQIDVRIAYTASPEADQTLSFRLLRMSFLSGNYDVDLVTDLSLGSNMGVTLNGVHTITYYDKPVGGFTSGFAPSYQIQFKRNCPSNDTISTPFGIREANGNSIMLKELYSP